MASDKNKQKKRRNPHDPERAQAIKWAARKHNVTDAYVRNILNGFAAGGRTDDIKRDFQKKYEQLKTVLY